MEPFKLEYETRYVAFLDVLGFSELTGKSDDESKAKLEKCIESIYKALAQHQGEGIKLIVLSDSIIISVSDEIEKLKTICIVIGFIQFQLALNGFLTRGGLTRGSVHMEESPSRVFGPGYIRAIKLEEAAKFPRVIVDPKILSDLSLTRVEFIDKICAPQELGTASIPLITSTEDGFLGDQVTHRDHFLFIDFNSTMIRFEIYSHLEPLLNLIRRELYSVNPWADKYLWMKQYMISTLVTSSGPSDIVSPIHRKLTDL